MHNLLLTFFVILSVNFVAMGQFLSVQTDRSFQSKDLSAIVYAPNGEPLAGVTVKLLTEQWKIERDRTKTNSHGFFTFRIAKPGMYFLELGSPGFQRHLYKIRVTRKVRFRPGLVMEVAT